MLTKAKVQNENEIYNTYSAKLKNFFKKKVAIIDDVDDLVVETLTKVLLKMDSYDKSYPLDVWVWSIANNHLIDYFRKVNTQRNQINKNLHTIEEYGIQNTNLSEAESIFVMEELGMLIKDLNDVDSQVVNLTIYEGLNHDEIAEKLGITSANVKHKLMYIKKKIKLKLRRD